MGYLANKLGDPNNLGYFATEAALNTAYPVGFDGAFAIVGATDTVWVWDDGTAAWVDTGGSGGSGTVTSVAMTVPTGLSVSGSPITTSGTFAVSLASGYEIFTTVAFAAKAPLTAPTFATSITGSYLTASEILITNGSKQIVSAPVATYPSLLELTYVKGVTSAIQTQIDALSGAIVLKGTWDASASTFPGGGSAQAGWSYIVSVGGTVDGEVFVVNDRIVAITDNASTGTYAGNWHKLDYTDAVLSVFGRTGAVVAVDGDYSQSLVTGLKTSDSPQFTGINLGHASDTTLARVSAGVISVEGVVIPTISSTNALTNKTLTNSNNVLGGVTMTLGSDANGDTYYRSGGVLTRVAKGTADQVYTMNSGATAPEWQDSAGGGGSGFDVFDLRSYRYANEAYYAKNQDSDPRSVSFKTDGTIMYVLGASTDDVFQYTLSTAWDITTATYASKSYAFTEDTLPNGVSFKSDGTKMYMVGGSTDSVYQYSLSTAWDVSTVSYDTVTKSVSSEDSSPDSMVFNSDGTKMYIGGSNNDTVYQYTLSTAWDLSTASYDTKSFNYNTAYGGVSAHGIALNDDGTIMYLSDATLKCIAEITLSTAYDVSTASYANKMMFNPTTTGIYGIFMQANGNRLFAVDGVSSGLNSVISYINW